MKRLIYILPALGFLVLAFFLFRSLLQGPPDNLPSALIGKPAPRIILPPLDAATQGFGPEQLSAGHVTVVNVFASWCAPCRIEAPQLAQLAHAKGFVLYGMVQKDTAARARAFLDEVGNPFARIGLDADGRAGIEWGVYGVPETYILDGRGIVRERFVGPITPEALASDIMPAIARAQAAP